MKIQKYLVATILFACSITCSYAHAAPLQQKKMYLDEKTVLLKKGRIMIKSINGTVRVKLLRSDKNGFYIFEQDLCSVKKGHAPSGDNSCHGCTKMFWSGEDRDRHQDKWPAMERP